MGEKEKYRWVEYLLLSRSENILGWRRTKENKNEKHENKIFQKFYQHIGLDHLE